MNIIRNINSLITKFAYVLTRRQKKYCYILFVLLFIGSFLEMLGVSIIVPLVNVMLSPTTLLNNPQFSDVVRFFSIKNTSEIVFLVAGFTVLLYLFKNIYMASLAYIKSKVLRKIEKELSLRLMKSYMKRPYIFHVNTNSSILVRSISSDATITITILLNIFNILIETMSIILIGFFLLITDYVAALTTMLLALFSFGIIILLFKKILADQGKIALKFRGECLRHINQAFCGIKEVLVAKRQSYFMNNYEKAMIKANKAATIESFAGEISTYIVEAICISGFIIMLCFKSTLGGDNAEFIALAAAFAAAAFRILPSMGKIANNFNQIVYYYPNLKDVHKNIHEVEEYETIMQDSFIEENASQEILINSGLQSTIKINKVSWKYPNSKEKVLEQLSLTINKGTSIGLVGESGAGKTTLADMILGLLPPLEGSIELDGVDIAKIPEKWSKIIGYVPQTVYLTDDTIRSNVAFGIEKKDILDALVWKALEQAQLMDFVQNLPLGLDTIVGERGIRFSGGQKQRIAIARALYYNPDILILDEATSALDNDTETAVMEAIESLHGHKTLIIVAHRLSTIKGCDEIYEIINGKAVQKRKEDVFV